jgi:hypothetical protein
MTERATTGENESVPQPEPSPPAQATESATTADEPGTTASGHHGTPVQAHLARVWGWLTARWWHWVAVVIAAVLMPALGVFGTSLGQYAQNRARHLIFRSDTHARGNSTVMPLGIAADVSYSYGNAVALAAPLSTGLGYADLLAGPSDTDPQNSWASLLARYNGAPIGELHVDFVLTGQDQTPVRVTDIQIQRVGPVMPPFSGTYIPIPHAGATAAFQFTANMDAPDPMIMRLPSGQTFPDFNVQLADGEQLTLSINFLATHYSCRWVLLVTYLTGTKTHVLKVGASPGGQPFVVTGPARTYKVRYASNFPQAGYSLTS